MAETPKYPDNQIQIHPKYPQLETGENQEIKPIKITRDYPESF
jgi:hypothetical protein